MDINKIQKEVRKDENRSVPLSIRTSKEKSEYMKEKNISPTKLFNESLDELMKENPSK